MTCCTNWLGALGALFSTLVVGCVGTGNDVCAAAESRITECGARLPGDFYEQCTPDAAEGLLGLSCDALVESTSGGKADGSAGWLEEGSYCWFNFQCVDDLVCRPTGGTIGAPQECTRQGTETHHVFYGIYSCGGWCDSNGDCESGHFCADQRLLFNGMCIQDGHETEAAQGACAY